MKDSSTYYTVLHTLTCLVSAGKETLSSLYLCFFSYNNHKVRKRNWNINAITYYHWFFLSYNYLLIHTFIVSTNMYQTLAICQTPCQAPGKPDPTRSMVYGIDRQESLLCSMAWPVLMAKTGPLCLGKIDSFENGSTKAHKRKMEMNLKYLSLCAL